MEEPYVAPGRIVHEVLTKDNYKRWKTLMKNYLVGQKLWSVVEIEVDLTNEDNKWQNAKALHIIQLSCGSYIFNEISDFDKAHQVWNHLCRRYGSESRTEPDIEQGVGDHIDSTFREMYKNVENGDWNGTEALITTNDWLSMPPDSSGRTILHVAALTGHVHIVKGILKYGREHILKVKDQKGYTALALVAHYTGSVDVAKCMIEINDMNGLELLGIPITSNNERGTEIPLLLAADKGHKQMTRYLYRKTVNQFRKLLDGDNYRIRVLLLERCIKAEIFDVALKLLDQPQFLAVALEANVMFQALRTLAQKPSAFLSACQFTILQQIIYHCPLLLYFYRLFGNRGIYEQKQTHDEVKQILKQFGIVISMLNSSQLDQASVYDAMLDAAKNGIVEFINAMAREKPELIWATDNLKRGIFSYAVLHRKEKVFKLIHTLNGRSEITKCQTDVFGNNLLHLAGHLGSFLDINKKPGAALQMQREIQWFKAVEKVVNPECKEAKNDENKKPSEVFTETHEELVKAGRKWAMKTGSAFAVVATFITTITFAAGFTVPGGNDQATGVPIFSNKAQFTTFVVADAISLFTSAISVLIFIWIQTSRYSEQDFLISFPRKLLMGLLFLFVSVVSMMVSFCAALAIVLHNYQQAPSLFMIGGIILGSILVFVLCGLITDIFQSTMSNI